MDVIRTRVSVRAAIPRISSWWRFYNHRASSGSYEPRSILSPCLTIPRGGGNRVKKPSSLAAPLRALFATDRVFFTADRAFFATDRTLSTSPPSPKNEWDYDEERRLFQLDCPKYYNFFADQIERLASCPVSRSRCALWWVDGGSSCATEIRWSFEEIAVLARKTSWLLKRCGLKRGDRLVVALPRVPEWWLINLACIRSGIVLIPGTTLLKPRDFRYRLLRSGASAVVVDETLVDAIDDVVDECPSLKVKVRVDTEKRDGSNAEELSSSSSPACSSSWLDFGKLLTDARELVDFQPSRSDDPLMIFFTSGTTGHPKMALHTHASYGLGHVITGKYALDLTDTDVHWNLADGGWAKAAWSSLFAPWLRGSTIFSYRSRAAAFDAEETLLVLKQFPVTTFCAAPTAVRMMVQQSLSDFLPFSALRLVISGGEPLNPEVICSWLSPTGIPIQEVYGQTETVALCVAFLNCSPKPGSMGKPPPGIDLRVIDVGADDCPPGVEGDIAVKTSPSRPFWLFAGYVDDPERTASVFRRGKNGDEFYLTGDRGFVDDEGFFWFVARDDDVIISAGYRVGPFEVESALIDHPDVVEAAVIGSPDPLRGQVVKAFVVLTENRKQLIAKEEGRRGEEAVAVELKAHVKSMTAPYKYPRMIQVVESLPKTISGKIRRVELRNKEWGR